MSYLEPYSLCILKLTKYFQDDQAAIAVSGNLDTNFESGHTSHETRVVVLDDGSHRVHDNAILAKASGELAVLKGRFNLWKRDGEPKIKELEGQVKAEKAAIRTLRKDTNKEISRLKSTIADISGKLSAANRQNFSLEKEVISLRAQLEQLHKAKNAVDGELIEERSFIKQLQAENQAQQAIVTRAQEAAVNMLSQTVSSELPDDVIREDLKGILDDAKDWARINYRREFQEREAVRNRFIEAGLLASDDDVLVADGFVIFKDSDADTLLETALNQELCTTFLRNPYLMAGPMFSPLEQDVKAGDKLHPMWNGVDQHVMVGIPNFHHLPKATRDILYKRTAMSFLARWGALIQDEYPIEEEEALLDVVTRFGDLALKLWRLNRDIKIKGLDYFGKNRFKVHSMEMVAAEVLHLQEGSTRLDGRQIPLVVQPMIVSYVRGDDKTSGKPIVWAKGVVWVSDKTSGDEKVAKAMEAAEIQQLTEMDWDSIDP
ncbi:uncharacterized protein PAC_04449 [Phialocephala subalpina]|uniref:Uncharacterized protein n=1 Tax=Phialocephala subalpina TaxID=576137 RepID=A0A1L7WP63_9HELO|nr:uncharacterized protein PAC_04449 [Phialocephala subalpina]